MNTLTYLSFGAIVSQALAYVPRKGHKKPMLKQSTDFSELGIDTSNCGPEVTEADMWVLEQCESTGNIEGDCQEISDRVFCHLLAELSDIEINPTDFDFSESGETTTDCGPEWTDEDEAQFEQCQATNFSEPGFTACEELAIRQFCLFNDQDWEDDWDNDWEDDWDSEWADWEDSSTENISVIAKCGHIPNFSDLEFVYQCFYKEDSSSSSLNCEEYQELHDQELCYFDHTYVDLMDPFYNDRNQNLQLVESDLPDFENLDLNDPNFSAQETCGQEMQEWDYDRLDDCYDTEFENPECKPVFLRSACYTILGFYQEHNNYYEGEDAEDDFSWANGTSTGGDGANEFEEVELDELEQLIQQAMAEAEAAAAEAAAIAAYEAAIAAAADAAAANATQPIDWSSTDATTTDNSATDGSTWADPATGSSTEAAKHTGCQTEWFNNAKLNFLENCRLNDYKFKPQCETFWYIDYGYSLDTDWDVCQGVRANEPGCQHYFNWYVEEEPCDGGDEASETQGDQGVAEVIDEQTLAEEEEDDGRWPRWLRITVWFFAIVIVLQIVTYLAICIPNPDDPYCDTTTTTAMLSRTFFTDLIDEFLPQKLVFDF